MHLTKWIFGYLFLGLVLVQGQNEEKSHSTSVAGMVNLLELEAELIDNLNDYAKELHQKLRIVRQGIAKMRTESEKAFDSMEDYVSNPLNAFSLIRRMHQDWLHWQLYMEEPVGLKQVDFLQQNREALPSSTDLEEAATSLDRIQTTYDLSVMNMTNGLLNGKQYNASLSALDSYAVSQYLYDQGKYGAASVWIYQTIEYLNKKSMDTPLELPLWEVLQLYAELLIKLNRYKDALQVLNMALTDKKNDINLLQRKLHVETLIRTEPDTIPKPFNKPYVGDYERGCRGEFASSADAKLHCIYNVTNSPFLKLAPLKMELVGLDPYMVLYHDVLSSSEIRELQIMATPSLKRATVYKAEVGRNEVVRWRTSKVAWFMDNLNPLTTRLSQRIEDMTRFDLEGSEMLQLMNYGLGGYYDKHYDFFNVTNSNLTRMNGDRIATVLFYLTDVEQGGATVFPNIQKAVFPRRGSAIMWYNLKDDGEGNKQTLHAACPVIVGSKWVCNKWIRERQQLFRRPCLKK